MKIYTQNYTSEYYTHEHCDRIGTENCAEAVCALKWIFCLVL